MKRPAALTQHLDGRTKSPRRRHGEILEAAARVFHGQGYESTSIQDIADEVGILKGSLYYYISSKEELLFEILVGVHKGALENLATTDATPGDALQKLRVFITGHVTYNARNLVRTAVFFHDFRSLSAKHRKSVLEARDHYERYLRHLIEVGQEDGVICPDLDPKTTTMAIFGMTNGIYHWYRPGGPKTPSEIGNELADLVIGGLACDPDTHSVGHRRQTAMLEAEPARGEQVSPT